MNMKIVIVEDEAAIRKGLAGLLPKISPDYEVAGTAADGREGLELIRREHPALVILDIRMPGMDGMTMLRVLRSEGNPCRAVGFCGLFFSQKVLMGMSGSSPVFSTFWITTS